MSTIAVHRPGFLGTPFHEVRNHGKFQRISASSTVRTMNSESSQTRQKDEISTDLTQKLSLSPLERISPSNLRFDRLQPSEQEALLQDNKIDLGRFVAREATLDEEYWTAAWLRAETHWENQTNDRYIDNYKRKFAEQEFNALKRRYKGQCGERCTCIVTVKKEEGNIKHTTLKSIVGTLDLSMRYLLHGETFPGERVKAPLFCSTNRRDQNRYGYVSNLCVAKSARRQGIAKNMLHFAIESARSNGAEEIFVHVHRKNRPAQELYEKMGFEVVELATPQLAKDKTYLLHFRT